MIASTAIIRLVKHRAVGCRLAEGLVQSDLETAEVREPFRRLASAMAVALHAVLEAMPQQTQDAAQVCVACRSLCFCAHQVRTLAHVGAHACGCRGL
jgi:hypothetical protein